ncbi:MAG: putative toxin-antitoxin system toxin component, family [Deltaproteobacteria bacterium]|jgi:putative PIN family toxin of toxin-antitoxin system|nr:putative toxin-antitoxin system toxin component, family [Deltaproteobacteria bacterium]
MKRAGERIRVFVDTNVLIAGIASVSGASGTLLDLCEAGILQMVISRQVLIEADRNISAKLPGLVEAFRRFIRDLAPLMMEEPSQASLEKCERFVDRKDVAILAAALDAEADFLITLDKKHFLKASIPPTLGIKVLSPGEFLRSLEKTFVEQ